MTDSAIRLPPRIETARLVLRRYEPSDVAALDGDAIHSIDHIGQFMPHARRAFDAGERFAYGIFLPDGAFVGNCGAHWTGAAELNIGYWVLLEHLRKGYATEAVRAVTASGFESGVRRFVLNCDLRNTASQGVARAAGFNLLSTDKRVDPSRGPYEEMTWELLPGRH